MDNKYKLIEHTTKKDFSSIAPRGVLEEYIDLGPAEHCFKFKQEDGSLLIIKSTDVTYISPITFPIEVKIVEEVLADKNGDVWPNIIKGFDYPIPPRPSDNLNPRDIGPKPEPIKFYVEKDKMEGKETYVSPFTGKVT